MPNNTNTSRDYTDSHINQMQDSPDNVSTAKIIIPIKPGKEEEEDDTTISIPKAKNCNDLSNPENICEIATTHKTVIGQEITEKKRMSVQALLEFCKDQSNQVIREMFKNNGNNALTNQWCEHLESLLDYIFTSHLYLLENQQGVIELGKLNFLILAVCRSFLKEKHLSNELLWQEKLWNITLKGTSYTPEQYQQFETIFLKACSFRKRKYVESSSSQKTEIVNGNDCIYFPRNFQRIPLMQTVILLKKRLFSFIDSSEEEADLIRTIALQAAVLLERFISYKSQQIIIHGTPIYSKKSIEEIRQRNLKRMEKGLEPINEEPKISKKNMHGLPVMPGEDNWDFFLDDQNDIDDKKADLFCLSLLLIVTANLKGKNTIEKTIETMMGKDEVFWKILKNTTYQPEEFLIYFQKVLEKGGFYFFDSDTTLGMNIVSIKNQLQHPENKKIIIALCVLLDAFTLVGLLSPVPQQHLLYAGLLVSILWAASNTSTAAELNNPEICEKAWTEFCAPLCGLDFNYFQNNIQTVYSRLVQLAIAINQRNIQRQQAQMQAQAPAQVPPVAPVPVQPNAQAAPAPAQVPPVAPVPVQPNAQAAPAPAQAPQAPVHSNENVETSSSKKQISSRKRRTYSHKHRTRDEVIRGEVRVVNGRNVFFPTVRRKKKQNTPYICKTEEKPQVPKKHDDGDHDNNGMQQRQHIK